MKNFIKEKKLKDIIEGLRHIANSGDGSSIQLSNKSCKCLLEKIEKLEEKNKISKKCNEEYYNMLIKNIEMALEIERLNYIVEDFEQWIKDSKREDFMALATINKIFFADELLNKLKELKGENNG